MKLLPVIVRSTERSVEKQEQKRNSFSYLNSGYLLNKLQQHHPEKSRTLEKKPTFTERIVQQNDPVIMGYAPSSPKIYAITPSKFSDLTAIKEDLGNENPSMENTQVDRINIENMPNRKLTARERWQKAIRKVIYMGKFNLLSKDLKQRANLFGTSSKGSNELKNSPKTLFQCIILPNSKFKVIWSGLLVTCLVFIAIYVPIRIAFLDNIPLEMLIFEYSLDGFFIIDIFINFISAYYDEDHNLIDNKKQIAKRYAKSWFLIDLIACFPFSVFEPTGERRVGYNKLLRLFRLGRLYRILKIFKSLSLLKAMKKNRTYERFMIAFKMNAGIKRLMKATITFIIVCHFFACLWFYTAKYYDFHPDTWVVRYSIADAGAGSQYLVSFYWVLTLTTIGYGDIIPYTQTERIISLIYIIVGVVFVSYSISSLSSIMFSSYSKTRKYKEKIIVLDELALSLNMDPEMYYKIKRIVKKNHETQFYSEMSNESLMEELPTSLKSELITLMYQQNHLDSIAFFQGKSPDFLNLILPLLKRIALEKDDVIYRDGDWADEMYFILKGDIKLVTPDNYVYRNYIGGSYFGESEILRKTDYRLESAIAGNFCELLVLKKNDLISLLNDHPDVAIQMEEVRNKRAETNMKSIQFAKSQNIKIDYNVQNQISIGKKSLFNKEFSNSPNRSKELGQKPFTRFHIERKAINPIEGNNVVEESNSKTNMMKSEESSFEMSSLYTPLERGIAMNEISTESPNIMNVMLSERRKEGDSVKNYELSPHKSTRYNYISHTSEDYDLNSRGKEILKETERMIPEDPGNYQYSNSQSSLLDSSFTKEKLKKPPKINPAQLRNNSKF